MEKRARMTLGGIHKSNIGGWINSGKGRMGGGGKRVVMKEGQGGKR